MNRSRWQNIFSQFFEVKSKAKFPLDQNALNFPLYFRHRFPPNRNNLNSRCIRKHVISADQNDTDFPLHLTTLKAANFVDLRFGNTEQSFNIQSELEISV